MKIVKTIITVALITLTSLSSTANPADVEQFGKKTLIIGTVADSISHETEPNAVLQFFSIDNAEKAIAFTTTDTEGRFSQIIEGKGEYYLLFSGVGRKEKRVEFSLGQKDTINLGTILVQDDIQALEGAAVTAQRVLVKMEVDKMTYDVENDVDSKTSTVLDMLRKVPMVSVDAQDNISVNGSTSFQVTVDGKPNAFFSSNPGQIFKMMPASAVKDIQVITNPGAKYDAEGVGGVLNITMARLEDGSKASTDGYFGNVQLSGGNRTLGGSVFYSQQTGKFTLNFTGTFNRTNMDGAWNEITRKQYTSEDTVKTHSKQTTKLATPLGTANLSASYEIDPQNLISVSAGYTGFGSRLSGTNSTSIGTFNYSNDMTAGTGAHSISANVDYQHSSKEVQGRMFTISYQFAGTPGNNDITNRYSGAESMPILKPLDMQSISKTNSMDHTAQADFTTPLLKVLTLSTGAKFIGRHNMSDSELSFWNGSKFERSDEGSVKYDFYNNIGALYLELSGNFGKFGAKAGVRYEHTWQRYSYSGGDDKNFSTNYGIAVPSASVQYNFGPLSNLGLSYNLRINRPGITYLNPYIDISDPTALSYGNPNLEIEKAHNVNLVYNYFSQKWIVNLTGRYTFNGNGISQFCFYDESGLLNNTYGNIVKSSSAGLNAFVTWIPGSKTRILVSGAVGYDAFSSKQLDQKNDGFTWSALVGGQQTLPWDIRLSANVILSGRTYSLQGWNSGISAGVLGLTKSFLDDRLTLSLSGLTNFNKGMLQIENHTKGKDFDSVNISAIPLRQITLSVTFSFGTQGIQVKKAARTISNDAQLNQSSNAESMNSSTLIGM